LRLNNLGGLEHDLSRVIEKHKGSLWWPQQYSRELAVGPPRIQDVLCSESITRDDSQVYKSLHKCEVPAIAELPNHQNTPMSNQSSWNKPW
jgi:hypothetical protein